MVWKYEVVYESNGCLVYLGCNLRRLLYYSVNKSMTSYLVRNIIAIGIIWAVAMAWGVSISSLFNIDINSMLTDDVLLFWGGMLVIFSVGFAVFAMKDTKADMKKKYEKV